MKDRLEFEVSFQYKGLLFLFLFFLFLFLRSRVKVAMCTLGAYERIRGTMPISVIEMI